MKTKRVKKVAGLSVNTGTGRFYWNGGEITTLWYNFFSELPMEKEIDCDRIFIRRYGKILDQVFTPITPSRKK